MQLLHAELIIQGESRGEKTSEEASALGQVRWQGPELVVVVSEELE